MRFFRSKKESNKKETDKKGRYFEMPLILLFSIKAGIINVKQLRRQWRIVYIIILLLCTIIAPDWSPVTIAVLAVPMILLCELAPVPARFFKN